jgi:hypothetical protein
VAKINIDYNGLSSNLASRAGQVLNTIVDDPNTKLLIDAQTNSLTFKFDHLGAVLRSAGPRMTLKL